MLEVLVGRRNSADPTFKLPPPAVVLPGCAAAFYPPMPNGCDCILGLLTWSTSCDGWGWLAFYPVGMNTLACKEEGDGLWR